ncbi:multidrug effflux MFS transporter [Aquimarina spongiae]|uniref:MFS transporter, DHA1 family, bicyclomycin/chloramphenicol resistance protein n=1 Tax=Aquimarina spongiae TaxID=570521 RepID=A0A1M6HF93_9FLAO|nr:multidrug effflux MFS transporter [Aquimarina spongiae]SHJ20856.1 MFS transporter, DHA1 family, bicyclomycin/chloramphenicol resistance protein [Aquimarina spongiae]
MNFQKSNHTEFVIILALLMASYTLTINMLLPAFDAISKSLKLDNKSQIQLSVSLLYMGTGISQLFYGALADAFGRKKIIYLGYLLFLTGCLLSFLSWNIHSLLAGQIIQGVGLGAPRVLSIAIARDKFVGEKMAKTISLVVAINIIVPVVSPILGKFILEASTWRMLFVTFFCFGLIAFFLFGLRIEETLSNEKRKSFTLKHILKAILEIFRNKKSIGYTIIAGLFSGVFIAYLNLSQEIFEFQYQLGNQYPFYFGFLAFSIGLALVFNTKLVEKLGMKLLVKSAIICSSIVSVIILGFEQPLSLWVFILFMFLLLFSYGILVGNLTSLAMVPFGHIAGMGSSIIGSISTLVAVPLSIIIGTYYDGTTSILVLSFFTIGIISTLIYRFIDN